MQIYDMKKRLQSEPLYGCFVTFPSSALTEVTAAIGFDFILIDNEHGNMNVETIEDMVRASHAEGVPCIVRVPYNRPEYIRNALDFGANGVQVPLVNTIDDLIAAYRPSVFPPKGDRGVAFLPRAANYGMLSDKKKYLQDADSNRLLSVHIETTEALNNLDAILDEGLADVYFVGPGDLAVSMGYAHDLTHSDVIKAIEAAIKKIVAKGFIAGTYVGSAEMAKKAADWGATYLVTAITPYMVKGGREYLTQCRE